MIPESILARGARVVSVVPGRIRLRAVDARGSLRLASVAEELSICAEVTSVDLRARSASLVVCFDPAHAGAVSERLRSLGIDPHAVVASTPSPGPAAAAASVNRAVERRLGGADLRLLVPLGLGLLAARRALRGEERLGDAPWYVLAWYASETLWKFHGIGAPAPEQSPTER